MDRSIAALIENAKAVSVGMIRVAATKPNDHPLQSNAETFRGTAELLSALSEEVARATSRGTALDSRLRRIASLDVRGAGGAITDGNWKAVVAELQAVAQEVLTPHNADKAAEGPRAPSCD